MRGKKGRGGENIEIYYARWTRERPLLTRMAGDFHEAER